MKVYNKIEDVYPLTPLQQGIFFQSQIVKNAYADQMSFCVEGKLNIDLLKEAYDRLISRHSILRTCFNETLGDEILQIVQTKVPSNFEYQDLSNEASFDLDKFRNDNKERGFDLSKGSAMRLVALYLGDNRHELIWSNHHIVMDGWCIRILIKEFFYIYECLLRKNPIMLPKPTPYASYIKWLMRINRENSLNYWKQYLKGFYTVSTLPKVADTGKTDTAGVVKFAINKKQKDAIKELRDSLNITENTFVQLIWSIILAKYNNTDDVVFGAVVSGRPAEIDGIEQMIGLFINTIPVRVKLDKEKPIREILKQIRLDSISSTKHHYIQLADIKNISEISYDLFDNIIVFQNYPDLELQADLEESDDEATIKLISVHSKDRATYDFCMLVYPGDEISLHLTYNQKLYNESQVIRLTEHFKYVVEQVLDNPDIKFDEIDYLSESEKQELLSKFNRAEQVNPIANSLTDLLNQQLEKTPNATALISKDQQLSFQELNEKSNQLAHYLIEHGVKMEEAVALCLPRSCDMMVGILGIFKAGGVYLPIDPKYPQERIDYILEDTQAKLVVTESTYTHLFKEQKNIQSLLLDDNTFENASITSVDRLIKPDNLAYIIYTSGSTGKPKGVMIEHKNLLYFFENCKNQFGFSENTVFPIIASNAFDIFLFESLVPILSGATGLMLNDEEIRDMNQLAEHLKKVNAFHMVPAFMRQLIKHIKSTKTAQDYLRIKDIFIGGDLVPTSVLEEMSEVFPNANLHILYGPTETTIFVSTNNNLNPTDKLSFKGAIIGKPLNNTEFYILNDQDQLCSIGIVGEICVSGPILARGYLNRPASTATKFIPNPIHHGQKMYKTGDLGKWLEDGSIEFIGRKDNQVKIKGYRIELGEVEHILQQQKDITASAVIVKMNANEDKELVAYVVSNKEENVADLRTQLAQALPYYMIPNHFIQLEELPLNTNGKLDKKKLPDPNNIGMETGAEYIAPRNEVEATLIKVFEQVLKKEGVGIKDNFFTLGGDSIKSIQIVSRLKQAGLIFALQDILKYPVIEELAQKTSSLTKEIDQKIVEGPVALGPIQLEFLQSNIAKKHHYNQSVLLKSKKAINEKALKAVFDKIVLHHDVLRMSFQKHENTWTQTNHGQDRSYGFEVLAYEDEVSFNKNCDRIQASLHLENGPLFKVVLFKDKAADHLLLVAHHLIIDGVSWRILFEDISSLYLQYLDNATLTLPLKTDSFMDWQAEQTKYASSKELQKEVAYWDQIESTSIPSIPVDFEKLAIANYEDLSTFSFQLNKASTANLLTKSYEAYRTEINVILITALGAAIQEVFGMDKMLIKMEGHGREDIGSDIDVTRTLGWFTTSYPVLFNMDSNDVIKQLIHVKENLHRIPNKGIGYGILKYLAGHLYKKNPDIVFNYLGDFGSGINSGEEELFTFSEEYKGMESAADMERNHLLDVNGILVDQQLILKINYNTKEFAEATINKLGTAYEQQLEHLIQKLATEENNYLTPADLTYKGLTIDQLNEIEKQLLKIEDVYPLSPLQQGLFFHSQISHEDYFEQFSFGLKGDLNIPLLKESFDRLIARHSVLRTCFNENLGDEILQIVQSEVPSNFNFTDLSVPNAMSIEDFREFDRHNEFDLSQGSPMRLNVAYLGDNIHELIWSNHHIILDGWCIGILIKEFFQIYECLLADQPITLKEISPYSNYIKWLMGIDKNQSLDYWKQYLKGYDTLTTVPKSAYADGPYRPNIVSLSMTDDQREKMRILRKDLNITENLFLQFIWSIVLGKYNNTDDVVFGAVVSGRPVELEGVEDMIGLFINTIPVRIKLPKEQSVHEILGQIREEAIVSTKYHYVQLADIQNVSELSHELFDSLFIFQNYPVQEMVEKNWDDQEDKASLEVISSQTHAHTNYNFSVSILPGQQLAVRFSFNENFYKTTQIERLRDHFGLVLNQILDNPSIKLDEIDYLTTAEKDQLLAQFSNSAKLSTNNNTIVDLLDKQLNTTPNAVALIFEDQSLTYADLNKQSNQIANILIENGIQPSDVVPVCTSKSFEMIAAMIGVFKAGGIYLAIDPFYPLGRTSFILDDCGAKCILTEPSHTALFKDNTKLTPIYLDDKLLEKASIESPKVKLNPQDLAYLVYKFDTNKDPIGLSVKHNALCAFFDHCNELFPFTNNSKTPVINSNTIDLFFFESLYPILTGGTAVLLSNKDQKEISHLGDALKNTTNFFLQPALLRDLVKHIKATATQQDYKGIQFVMMGMEHLTNNLLNELREVFPNARLFSLYGNSESTIFVAANELTNKSTQNSFSITTIGQSSQYTDLYVLDHKDRICSIGVEGEICISGPTLANGYWNNADLDGECFVVTPFNKDQKMYRTGEIGKWLEDGQIALVGNKNTQAKISGHQVELAKVRQALEEHESIELAIVQARKTETTESEIVAYLISDEKLDIDDFRNSLSKYLPLYMLPSYFVQLENVPLTSEGRVDKSRLPEPKDMGAKTEVTYLAPRNEIEETLVAIWQEVLGVDKVGLKDDFFLLGGHSLKAIRVITLIHKKFNVKLNIKKILQDSTIENISAEIEKILWANNAPTENDDTGETERFII